MSIRKRKVQANYLKIKEAFELLGTGFSELNESPSAQTTSKRYINQSSSSQSVTGYEWGSSFNTDQIVSDKAIEHIREIGEMQKVGADAESEYIIVDLDKPGTEQGTYRSRKLNVAIAVDSFDDNDGELGISGNFLGQSDPIEGTFNITTRTFTAGFNEALGTLNVVSSASATTAGKTKLTVTPIVTGGNSYKYKTAASLSLPVVNELCNEGYIVWDGVAEITATTGNKILIVEIDPSNKVKKAGIATVTSKS